ncbi:hypothetical protein [Rhodothermus profundi]|uniref:AhpC/TSA family protein n=1 Tax=Rhodothermus profundi TaxID=633813 RepID=A0A1M6XRV2_9BACT|nr:hypothetical protein [Rhodothermus profundi]SHL08535.1 hypothetical protein SAMN04488087_2681 [Rhodothermus profundi]
MSAAWKIGLGLLLVALSWGLYGWQTQRRLPQVPFPSEAFVPVWSPREAASATAVARGEVLLFFSPDDCGQTVARTAAFWVEGAQALGFQVVGILEDRSRAQAWRYAAGMGFPFAVWWDSLGWYGQHYGSALLPRALVRWEGRVVAELGPAVLRTVRGVESVRLLLTDSFRDEQ